MLGAFLPQNNFQMPQKKMGQHGAKHPEIISQDEKYKLN